MWRHDNRVRKLFGDESFEKNRALAGVSEKAFNRAFKDQSRGTKQRWLRLFNEETDRRFKLRNGS
jgi:hypothetical protein